MSSKSRLEALENLAAGDEGQDIRFFFTSSDDSTTSQSFRIEGRLPTLDEAENVLVGEAMRQAGSNQGIAASLLGISRPALNRRLNRRLRHLLDT